MRHPLATRSLAVSRRDITGSINLQTLAVTLVGESSGGGGGGNQG